MNVSETSKLTAVRKSGPILDLIETRMMILLKCVWAMSEASECQDPEGRRLFEDAWLTFHSSFRTARSFADRGSRLA